MIAPGTRPEQFQLNEPTRRLILDRPPRWGHRGLSEVTFYRTYSRKRPDGRNETWGDCVVRVVEGQFSVLKTYARLHHIPWNEARGQRLAAEAAERMHCFKWTPPGRGLSMMGTDYVWERGAMALNNCAYTSTERMGESEYETLLPFTFLMDSSMLGVGVGFDTEGAGKIGVKGYDGETTYRVPDTREGWVEAVRLQLRNGLYGGPYVHLDVQDVRPEGAPLRSFGGVASGPLPLVQGVRGVADMLMARRGQDVTSVLITDLMNLEGKVVVSGNVRRTAEIGFSKPGDSAFANMKNWDQHRVETGGAAPDELREESPEDYAAYAEHVRTPHTGVTTEITRRYADRSWAYKFGGWRWASNNSVMETVGADYSVYDDPISRSGEPGIAWLDTMRAYGRLKDPPNHRDYRVKGGNPCFTGDTLVAVADGRGAVPISQLAYENKDVPVYSVDYDNNVQIKWARNPRLTRESSQIVEITLDDDSTLRVTPDHGMRLIDGTKIRAVDLTSGQSLTRFEAGVNNLGYVAVNSKSGVFRPIAEHREILKFHDPKRYEQMRDPEVNTGFLRTEGVVAHHKNGDKLDNRPENLEWRLFNEHASNHASKRTGSLNSMFGKTHLDATREAIGAKTRERSVDPTFKAKLRESHTDALRVMYSVSMKRMRDEYSRAYIAEQVAMTDLRYEIEDGVRLYALKSCIICNKDMRLPWRSRSSVFCSHACQNKHPDIVAKRTAGVRAAYAEKNADSLERQIVVYKNLECSLGRPPLKSEWQESARLAGATLRLQHTAGSYVGLKSHAAAHNHRVKSVRLLDVEEPVYNLTVDDNHTVAIVTSMNKSERSGVITYQCLEQSLESFEVCNLVETYPAHAADYWDFQRSLKFAYLYAKTVTLLGTHVKRTNEIIIRNRRIGCSMSGVSDAVTRVGRTRFLREWCDQAYDYVSYVDKKYSEWLGVRESIKRTSNKPSGTVSLVAGVYGPGCHQPEPEGYRTMRLAATSPIVVALREARYRVEPSVTDPTNTVVVYFPWLLPEGTKTTADVGLWEQVKSAADMQFWWADNQVSYTAKFTSDEAANGEIGRVLTAFDGQLKGISLIGKDLGGYAQAPFTAAPREEVVAYAATLLSVDWSLLDEVHEAEDKFCDGERCEIAAR